MTNLMAIYLRGFAVFLLLLSTATTTVAVEELNTEGLIQRHLNSIGTAEARASVKSRVVEGRAAYRVLVGGSGQIDGKCVMVSERDRLQALFKINAIKYHGEKFVRNGDKTFVAGTYDDGTRSEFGQFLRSEDIPLREGTLGGVWSAGWPLLNLSSHNAKFHYDGLKKVDGQPLHAATYRGKKSADMEITLFFEPDTFRHVMSVYSVRIHAGIGFTETESARQQETRYRIEERFSDFKSVDGITLPYHYNLRFQQELQSGFTKLVEWDSNATRVLNNVDLDAKNFETN